METSQTSTRYDCDICKDEEWILDIENNSARACICREKRLYRRIIENSGLTEAFQRKTFDTYDPNLLKHNAAIQQAAQNKEKALHYTNRYESIKDTKKNSLLLIGQVGSGKTHLALAVLNQLMARNIGVKYMEYVSEVKELKQLAMYKDDYEKKINSYKTATVLLIDDLFKKGTYIDKYSRREVASDVDIRIIYEIINYRSLNNKPFIITSEYSIEHLVSFDEALGSRILEMSKGNIIAFKNVEGSNFRIYGDY